MNRKSVAGISTGDDITLFMCGDVMTGRGIDQVLPYPADSTIHEPYLKNAKDYVYLAEEVNGPLSKPVSF
jgi:poly-gamma-glutamate capsule biosynthesis protein CapA/YwtB (metallophosphatase superfamily)